MRNEGVCVCMIYDVCDMYRRGVYGCICKNFKECSVVLLKVVLEHCPFVSHLPAFLQTKCKWVTWVRDGTHEVVLER